MTIFARFFLTWFLAVACLTLCVSFEAMTVPVPTDTQIATILILNILTGVAGITFLLKV